MCSGNGTLDGHSQILPVRYVSQQPVPTPHAAASAGNAFSPCSGTLLAHSAALLVCRGLSRSSAWACLSYTAQPYSASQANRLSAVFIDAWRCETTALA